MKEIRKNLQIQRKNGIVDVQDFLQIWNHIRGDM